MAFVMTLYLCLYLYLYLYLCASISNITPRKPQKASKCRYWPLFPQQRANFWNYVTLFLSLFSSSTASPSPSPSSSSSSSSSFFGYYFEIMAELRYVSRLQDSKTETGRAYWSSISFGLSNFCVT